MSSQNGHHDAARSADLMYHAARLQTLSPGPAEELAARMVSDMPRTSVDEIREVAETVAALPTAELPEVLATLGPVVNVDTDFDADAERQGPESPIVTTWGNVPLSWLTDQPPRRRYLVRHPTVDGGPCPPREGDGLLPCGKAATLSSAGGVGKTNLVLQLAVSVATGSPWLGHFQVGRGVPDRVLLLLGEEDVDEVRRRLFFVCEALGLGEAERKQVASSVVALPLAGRSTPLLELGPGDEVTETEHLRALWAQLNTHAGDDGWGLIVLDPQARMAGIDVESSNVLATRFVQETERLTEAPGNPTVLVVAHSSKLSRRANSADSRGVSGLTDGFRWHATLSTDNGAVIFKLEKSNYSKPTEPIRLDRGAEGLLFVESDDARQTREDAACEAAEVKSQEVEEKTARTLRSNLRRVVRALGDADPNTPKTKAGIVGMARMKKTVGLTAMDAAIAEGLITNSGNLRAPNYVVTDRGHAMLGEVDE